MSELNAHDASKLAMIATLTENNNADRKREKMINSENNNLIIRHNDTDYEIQEKNANGYDMFNCTRIWEMDGKQDDHRFQKYARTEAGQKFIIERFRELNAHDASKVYATETLTFTLNKPLPAWVTDGLIETKQGRGGGTWAEKRIALHYASWCSVKLASVMIEAFERFGGVVTALRNGDTTSAVIEADKASKRIVAEQIEAEGETATENKVKARESGIKARRAFTDVVYLLLGKDASEANVSLAIGKLTNMAYDACFGVIAKDMYVGLQTANPRDTFSTMALKAVEYAESALTDGIATGKLKSLDDLNNELCRISPMLKMMANQMGSKPLVMENTNTRGGSRNAKGTFQGLLPEGADKVGFIAKRLTCEN